MSQRSLQPLLSLLSDLRTGLVRLFWPDRPGCLWCGEPLAASVVPDRLCPTCRGIVTRAPISGRPREPLASVAAVGPYEGGLAQAIRDLKYRRRRSLVPSLGQALAGAAAGARLAAQAAVGDGQSVALKGQAAPGPVLVPVPLHPRRFQERGFNQSELLGWEVSRLLGWPLEGQSLLRVRATHRQARLGRSQREQNLNGAFAVRAGWAAPGHVVLIDDVYTTGATASACAEALVRAGARRVDILTLAIER